MNIPVLVQEEEPTERFCNWTFQRESDLPEGQTLRMCTRCQGCWYVSRQAQMDHWPFHRRVCCSVEQDWANLRHEAPNEDLFEYFGASLQNYLLALEDPRRWIKGRLLLWAFQGIKRQLSTVQPDQMEEFLESNFILEGERGLYNLVHDAFQQCLDQGGQQIIDNIWAIPGWTNYFLSDQPFLSRIIKFRKENGLPAVLPTDARIVDSPGYLLPTSYFKILTHMYENCWTQLRPERRMVLSAQRVAVLRGAMRAWSCQYCRTCIPSADGFRSEFFLRALGMPLQRGPLFLEYCQPDEIVPGLTAKQLFLNIISDELFLPYFVMDGSPLQLNDLYVILQTIHDNGVHFEDDETHPWSHLSARDRIEILDLTHDWHFPNEAAGLCPNEAPDYFSDNIRGTVIRLIMGTSTRILMEMHELCRSSSPAPNARTIHFVETTNSWLLQRCMRNVLLYNGIMEPRAIQRGERHGLPEDLLTLIASFTFPRKYFLYSRRHGGQGLILHTEEEEAIEQSRWEERYNRYI